MRIENFWQWEGRVNRATYFLVGVSAFLLKFAVDWVVVTRLFHRPWSLLNYWRPFGAITGLHSLRLEDRLFAGTMMFVALPFIWLGLAMTVKRLRDAGEPTWLAALFFCADCKFAVLSGVEREAVRRCYRFGRGRSVAGSQCYRTMDTAHTGGQCAGQHRAHCCDRPGIYVPRYASHRAIWLGTICRIAILPGLVRRLNA